MPSLSDFGKPKSNPGSSLPNIPVGPPPPPPARSTPPPAAPPPAPAPAPLPFPTPAPAPSAPPPNLFRAIFDAWIQTWKDGFRMAWWLMKNPWAFIPVAIISAIGVWIIFAIQSFIFTWGTLGVAALSVFCYLRSLDRYALKLVRKNHEVPPLPPEPKYLTTAFKALGRPETPKAAEGDFRHYFARVAWWDFRVTLLEAFRSVTEISRPISDYVASMGGGNMLMRAFTFPIMAMVGVVALFSVVFFAGMGLFHFLAMLGLYLVSFLHAGKVSNDAEPNVDAPRSVGGYTTLATWAAVVLLPFALAYFERRQAPTGSTTLQSNAVTTAPAPTPTPAPTPQTALPAATPEPQAPEPPAPAPAVAQPEAYNPTPPTPPPAPALVPVPVNQPVVAPPAPARKPEPAKAEAARTAFVPTAPVKPAPAPTPAPERPRPTPIQMAAAAAPPPQIPPPPTVNTAPAPAAAPPQVPAMQTPAPPPAPVPAPKPVVVAPPAPTAPAYNGPTSGKFSYAGSPVPQNGEIVIQGLPPGNLKLSYDTNAWSHRVAPGADGRQRVILRSKKPGTQSKAEVTWALVP